MKKLILKMTFIGCIAIFSFASCGQSVQEAQDNVTDAEKNLEIAEEGLQRSILDSTEMARYKSSAEENIASNEQKLIDLKVANTSKNKTIAEQYEKDLKELEAQNAQLKKDVHEYEDKDMTKWEEFTLGFNQRMDKLGKSISEMAERNIDKNK